MVSQKKKNRHGVHRDELVLLGRMVEPEKKAIAIVTAAAVAQHGEKMTVSDLLWKGIETFAFAHGVIDADGNVTPKFKDWVTIETASVISKQATKRMSISNSRGK